ncbi:MAG TPA: ATP-binding protein, partial [Abditibacteriaceae bacterium]
MNQPFFKLGTEVEKIDVRLSYRIIELFSEGLYASPNKAIEELVSNSWDAGAENVHVLVPANPETPGGQIVVVDDGIGMDKAGLHQHWLLGESSKRHEETSKPKGRTPIGKFGIGKLATYVLANRLTHITKSDGNFYSTSMDYLRIDKNGGSAAEPKSVQLALNNLTEAQAQEAVEPWTKGKTLGHKALTLFGSDAKDSWTVTIMSGLKPMAKKLTPGRLRWVLETAMPLGDDFKLYLNGARVLSSKLKEERVGTWVIGKDIGTQDKALPKPASADLEVQEDIAKSEDSMHRFGVYHPVLGRVTGFVEAFKDDLGGKSDNLSQSNGFFVYVHGRRINVDDPGFGID